MVNLDVLATFPCHVRRRGQVWAASGSRSQLQHARSFDRCSSLTGYRRANAKYASLPRLIDLG